MPVTPFHLGPGIAAKAVSAVALALVIPARWFVPAVARMAARSLARVDGYPGWLMPSATAPGWIALFVGAITGALSHVALDAIVHVDVRPFGGANPFHVPGRFVTMHVACAVAGLAGAAIWGARARFRRARVEAT